MFTKLVWLFILVSPLSAAVAKHAVNSCSPTEFACGDGGCVSAELVCDGARDCADGGDESTCGIGGFTLRRDELVLNRSRRQASTCRSDQWRCRDGSCISFDGKCDGIVDCRDGSDETHALCRNNICQHNWFRCTYGACVDGTAPCNGDQDCADNSDELLPRCRNETDEVRGQFKCLDGSTIPASDHCDGTKDCADGSDETVRSCAAKTCSSYLFQCAYGACVDSGADCNQVQDCADGSDEAPELCDKSGNAPITPVKPQKGNCIMPPYPEHGTYVTNIPGGRPGEAYDFLAINVTCRQGYGVDGSRSISCYNGWWPEPIPKCVSLCHLSQHPSVEYHCLVTSGGVDGIRTCSEFEPSGTVVSPRCRSPNYYSPTALRFMHCIDGTWDYVAICSPGLTKNGTNITILIKDSVEVHVSDLEYVVPISNSNVKPVVPVTDNTYNNRPSYANDNEGVNKYSGVFEPVTSKPYNNFIDTDSNNSHKNEATDTKSYESLYEIDSIDWRMGVPDNRSTKIPRNTYTKTKIEGNYHNTNDNPYVNENSYSNVYQAIKPTESSKNIYKATRTTTENIKNIYQTIRTTTENSNDQVFDIDVRFGSSSVEDDSSNSKNTSTTPSNPKKSTENTEAQIYTSKSNNTNIYVNIRNSSVNIHADGKVIYQN